MWCGCNRLLTHHHEQLFDLLQVLIICQLLSLTSPILHALGYFVKFLAPFIHRADDVALEFLIRWPYYVDRGVE